MSRFFKWSESLCICPSILLCLSPGLRMTSQCKIQKHHYVPMTLTPLFIFQILGTLGKHDEGSCVVTAPEGGWSGWRSGWLWGHQIPKGLEGGRSVLQEESDGLEVKAEKLSVYLAQLSSSSVFFFLKFFLSWLTESVNLIFMSCFTDMQRKNSLAAIGKAGRDLK